MSFLTIAEKVRPKLLGFPPMLMSVLLAGRDWFPLDDHAFGPGAWRHLEVHGRQREALGPTHATARVGWLLLVLLGLARGSEHKDHQHEDKRLRDHDHLGAGSYALFVLLQP